MDDEVFFTELIVGELVINAIRYAEPPVRLRLIRDRTPSVEVSDGSSAAPYPRPARTTCDADLGRGAHLIGGLTSMPPDGRVSPGAGSSGRGGFPPRCWE
ncbi:hypothetical protein SSP24_80510 [Streptomyces spinoverrucosus]|uniref:Histidine kinase/HSP90-like ATPase domain-containing protein n=1 Tax=Streptomyces spinoverrucosus TaxID=284043 RepID=A0A4Y3VZB7_9ACTN|nr:ATP-binding protein [Streptomyces spinoverrucosus]GEC10396.1 hypothetical protein SSP24_80510 [Streptomyces spinoverrucosus]GHB93859.1 hypothetical protein GCM10010397_78390 [Streptomyces spinoverrucosus]